MSQISADPSDINVLPEYSDDPRVVQNLLDGVNRTRDDLHMWLAPFFPGRPHTVTLTFTSNTILAMVRIWVSATVPLSEYIQCMRKGRNFSNAFENMANHIFVCYIFIRLMFKM